MKKVSFSVIIPTLNEEKYLPNLLNDLRDQKYKSFEVIIVDGYSEDKTQKVAAEYRQYFQDCKIILSKKRNLSHQRNLGAKKAKGDYLIFPDADVRLNINYLQRINEEISKSNSLFLTTYQLPDTEERLDLFLVELSNYTLEFLSIINKQMAPGYNFIIEKKIFFKAGGFDITTKMSEDHELSIRVFKKTGIKLKIIKEPLIKWSFRRIKKEGRIPVILKYSLATLQFLTIGKIDKIPFSYKTGGHNYETGTELSKKSFDTVFKKVIYKFLSGLE